jgi:hypothetical protein
VVSSRDFSTGAATVDVSAREHLGKAGRIRVEREMDLLCIGGVLNVPVVHIASRGGAPSDAHQCGPRHAVAGDCTDVDDTGRERGTSAAAALTPSTRTERSLAGALSMCRSF